MVWSVLDAALRPREGTFSTIRRPLPRLIGVHGIPVARNSSSEGLGLGTNVPDAMRPAAWIPVARVFLLGPWPVESWGLVLKPVHAHRLATNHRSAAPLPRLFPALETSGLLWRGLWKRRARLQVFQLSLSKCPFSARFSWDPVSQRVLF